MPRTERVRTPQRRAGSRESPVSAGPSPPARAPHCPWLRAGAWRVGGGHGGARRLLAAGSVEGTVHGEGGRRTGVRGPHFLGAETDREGEVRSDLWPDG